MLSRKQAFCHKLFYLLLYSYKWKLKWDALKSWNSQGIVSKSGKPPLSLIFLFQTPDILCTFSFLTLYITWSLAENVTPVGVDKNRLFCKGWSCHLHYTKAKEKENHLWGGHGALSHLGSQSTLQTEMNSAQVLNEAEVKVMVWLVHQSAESTLTSQRALSLNTWKWCKGVSCSYRSTLSCISTEWWRTLFPCYTT